MVAHACNQETEAGELPRVQYQPVLHTEFWTLTQNTVLQSVFNFYHLLKTKANMYTNEVNVLTIQYCQGW